MKKPKVTRRDFFKATAVTTAATAAVLVGKEVVEEKFAEANLDDLEVVQPTAPMSCLDMLKAQGKKS